MKELAPGGVFCDFCSAPPITVLPIPDFLMGLGLRSVEGWAVCATCKRLVEENKREDLLSRALAAMSHAPETFPDITLLHAKFWSIYTKEGPQQSAHQVIIDRFLQLKSSMKHKSPPWINAYEERFKALKNLETYQYMADPTITWKNDMAALRVAETYSFSGDAFEAIKQLATKVPLDSPLWPDQVPGIGQGWWWFEPEFEVKTSNWSNMVSALLWGYVSSEANRYNDLQRKYLKQEGGKTAWIFPSGSPEVDVEDILSQKVQERTFLMFSAYTPIVVEGKISVLPASLWRWHLGETIQECVARTGTEYDKLYGPGGKFERNSNVVGRDHTLHAVTALCSFYLAACIWIEQEYLEFEPKKIERHRRKAFIREHKLTRPISDVQVIALRRRHKDDPADPNQVHGEGHRLTCRFLVEGHIRNQPYGPGRAYRKSIYIAPYPKGPEGAPFRQAKKKIFAVIR